MSVRRRRAPKAGDGRREVTLYLREALLEEARSAVITLGAQGRQPSSLSQLFDAAFGREMARLRRAHNDGGTFPPHPTRTPGGAGPTTPSAASGAPQDGEFASNAAVIR
jgi:hypothetical protein